MAVIGITGGIGSGKSTLCGFLEELLPAEMFDADRVARDVLANDPEVREALVRDVSPLAYREDGLPDREELRRVVFADPAARARLEAIVHPRVRASWKEKAQGFRRSGGHFLVDIPLLYETGAEEFFDEVVVVGCAAEIQLERVCARGVARDQAEAIMLAQLPTLEKVARADRVVWNDGSLRQLEAQARELASRWLGFDPRGEGMKMPFLGGGDSKY